MKHDFVRLALLTTPLVIAALVAATDASRVNDGVEAGEAWLRRRCERARASGGWFNACIQKPILWAMVVTCNVTNGVLHRGLRNGVRVAAMLYLLALWLLLLYAAVLVVLALLMCAAALWLTSVILTGTGSASGRSRTDLKRDWRGAYQEHADGSRSYEKEGWRGKYLEHADGSRTYEREDWRGKYLEHPDGSRSYEKEDWRGKYLEHADGSRSYLRKDWRGSYLDHEG